MLDITTVSLLDLCNPAVKNDKQFVTICEALDPQLQSLISTIPNNQIFTNLSNQASNILDYIALYHFNVDYYQTTWSPTLKLTALQNVIEDKINKGTPQRILDIINQYFGTGSLIEWFNEATGPVYGGDPYAIGAPNTFRVSLTTSDPTALTNAYNAIIAGKNARSYFIGFITLGGTVWTQYIGIMAGRYDYQQIQPIQY